MIVSRIRHTGFVVRSLERSLDFYCNVLDLTIYKRQVEEGEYIEKLVGIKKVRLEWVKLNIPGGGLIELLEYKSHPGHNASEKPENLPSNLVASGHISLTVDNLEKIYKLLIKKGYFCNSEPLIAPDGKIKILYCHDPDGIILELIEDSKIEDSKLVTICVPTYNRARTYLRATLDSILAQTYKNFELIISDNASTDDTERVCREYMKKDSRIKYIQQEKNIGGILNRNFIRRQGSGKYFVEICDDDLMAPTFLEKCINCFELNPEIVFAGGNFVEFDDLNRKVKRYPELFYPLEKDLYSRLKRYILSYESDGKDMLIYCGAWLRSIVAKNAFFDYRYFGWDFQDMGFVFRGLAEGKIKIVDEIIFYKRAVISALNPPKKKFFIKRIFDSFFKSRFFRLFTPFFYKRMIDIFCFRELSYFEKIKLIFWNLFVMSRLFWKRKI